MKKPLVPRSKPGNPERGITMILVALAMIAIIAMAALSIDVITLYLAKLEAQRAADTAAVAAAKVIALSGITGDPNNQSGNWALICGPDNGTNGLATRIAKATAAQNTIGGIAATTVTVTYAAGDGNSIGKGVADCSALALSSAFGVNPIVNVQLTRAALPNFFSRIWGNAGTNINASASAEAFNPSNSGNVGNQNNGGPLIPVQPRCVKPWVVPNLDPLNPSSTCTTDCTPIVSTSDGSIQHPGISLNGTAAGGIIGETFWLVADCQHNPNTCSFRKNGNGSGTGVQPQANYTNSNSTSIQPPPNLLYLPALVGTPVIAIPSCTSGDPYEEAIEGCDQPTNYSCGVPNANVADLRQNPANPTSDGVECLIHQGDLTNWTQSSGQDYFNSFAAPNSYPFQIFAGSSNPIVSGASLPAGSQVTTSPSIVSLPIYDNVATSNINPDVKNNVTFVGFLQVFINAADNNGNVNVTVLNVAGCGNGSPPVGNPVTGNSPLPVRLITPP
ncbi:MAG TPA: pilus assembly protein TadG-related protein [Candidatus Sulfotelmatobacter sp.]|nr:pilus assembly protein TadG-related protein [Candidatus Sulfotelmatobacter sp.]